jgi:hypothetical protein
MFGLTSSLTAELGAGLRRALMGTTALLPAALLAPAFAQAPNAVPTGGRVSAGQASISRSGTSTATTGNFLTNPSSFTAGSVLALRSGGAMTITQGTLNASSDLTIDAGGGLTATGSSLAAGRDLSATLGGGLTSTSNTLTANRDLRAGLGGTLTSTSTTLSAGRDLIATVAGAITVSQSGLRAGQSDQRVIRLQAGSSLDFLGSTLTADRGELVSGSTGTALSTAGSTFNIGTGLLLSARGGVGRAGEAETRVLGLSATLLPLTIIDTRRAGGFLSQLPSTTELFSGTVDRPGLASNAQAWQVPGTLTSSANKIFGVNDGTSTTPSSAEAGNVILNLRAGDSSSLANAPVFLLLNGGTATGTLIAGRLGVLGLPGSNLLPGGRAVELFGTLSKVDGVGAARFGALAGNGSGQAPSAASLPLYRFNNCVISTVNCVVPTTQQLPPLRLNSNIDVRTGAAELNDADVLLPNVGERDF